MAGIDGPVVPVKQGNLVFNPDGSVLVLPFGGLVETGDDGAQINLAHSLCPDVRLGPWAYSLQSAVSIPWPNRMTGVHGMTVLNYSGNGSAVFMQDTQSPQALPVGQRHFMGPHLEGIIVDGSNAGPAAIGIDIQEMSGGCYLDVLVRNFTGASAIGLRCADNNYSTNQVDGRVNTANCTTHVQFGALASEGALEAIDFRLWMALQGSGQTGVSLADGASLFNSLLRWYWLMQPNAVAAVAVSNSSVFNQCDVRWRAEFGTGQTPGTAIPVSFAANNAQTGMLNCRGSMWFGGTFQDFSNIGSLNPWDIDGWISGDSNLKNAQGAPTGQGYGNAAAAQPNFNGSGVAVPNPNPYECLVYVQGGTISGQWSVTDALGNTENQGEAGPFCVPNGGAITPQYSVQPSFWHWKGIGG